MFNVVFCSWTSEESYEESFRRKKFVCKECSRFISQAQHLKHHMRTHSGENIEKPFVYKEFSVLLSSSTSEVTWGVILEKSHLFLIQEKKHLFIRNVQTSHLKFRGELWRHFLKKCLNVRQKLGTRTLTLSLSLTLTFTHSGHDEQL